MDETKDSTASLASRIYEERIRPLVEEEHFGKVVSIDVNSGDYEIARDRQDRWPALDRLRGRHDDPRVFTLRIGGGPVAKIGGFRRLPRQPR